MNLTDELYFVHQISNRLKRFHKVRKNHFMFRCPVCGDSKKSESKTRGTIYPRDNKFMYGCFNCGASMKFSTFLKDFDANIYKEYVYNSFNEKSLDDNKPKCEEVLNDIEETLDFETYDIKNLFDLVHIFPVTASSKAVKYLRDRKVENFNDIYFTTNAFEIVNKFRPSTKRLNEFLNKEAILFPLMTIERVVFGFQMRFLKGDLRYMTIMVDSRFSKIGLLQNIDFSKLVFVFEGIFDALMVDNSLANLDASLYMISEKTKKPKDNFVLVFDNDTRNKEVMGMMKRGIEDGYKIFFFPEESKQYGKDFNEIKKNNPNYFKNMLSNINQYIKSGLSAKLEFSRL